MKDAYIEEFVARFRQNLDLKRQMEVFMPQLGDFIWDIFPPNVSPYLLGRSGLFGRIKKSRLKDFSKSKCSKRLSELAERSRHAPSMFECARQHGFILPLGQGNKLYAFIMVFGLTYEIPDKLLNIFSAFTQTIMRQVQKEMELAKVYETIRPRTIALSTIHTVHRLIGSTQDLNELIPRIARLCLQVMRCQQCRIYMSEAGGKRLRAKGIIKDGRDITPARSGIRVKGRIEKVVKNGASILTAKKLVVPLLDEDIMGVVSISNKVGGRPFTEFDKEILTTFAEQAVVAIKNAQLYQEQRRLTLGSIKSLAMVLSSQTPHTYAYSAGFADLAAAIADQMHIHGPQKSAIRYAAILHDAGKVMVPEEILKKTEKLTGKEVKIIRGQPEKGAQILSPLEHLRPVMPIIIHHHEKYDGTGYPKGLKQEEIPLGSRIMAVADAFFAMVSKRPYRQKMSAKAAVEEIKKNAGIQFDPRVVDAFLTVVKTHSLRDMLKKEDHVKCA